jgi:transposase
MLKWEIEELDFLEEQKEKLEREIAEVLQAHAAAVQRLAEVPGLGTRSAQQIIALVGPAAPGVPVCQESGIVVCPGEEVSAGQAHSTRSPKGNRKMRAVLNQAAHAAVKMKGSICPGGLSPPPDAHDPQGRNLSHSHR